MPTLCSLFVRKQKTTLRRESSSVWLLNCKNQENGGKLPSFEKNTQDQPAWLESVSESQGAHQTRTKPASQANLAKVFYASLKISLIPLIIAIFFGLKEWQAILYLENNGVVTQAVILDRWVDGQRWKNYFVRYEFQIAHPEGEVKRIIHEEELTASRYHALQPGTSVPVRYVPDGSDLIRSGTISISALKSITTSFVAAGVLFSPGWSVLLLMLFTKLGREHGYGKYIFLPPLFGYIGVIAELGAMGLARNYHFPFWAIFIMLGIAALLGIGDIFRIPWLTDIKARQ